MFPLVTKSCPECMTWVNHSPSLPQLQPSLEKELILTITTGDIHTQSQTFPHSGKIETAGRTLHTPVKKSDKQLQLLIRGERSHACLRKTAWSPHLTRWDSHDSSDPGIYSTVVCMYFDEFHHIEIAYKIRRFYIRTIFFTWKFVDGLDFAAHMETFYLNR